MEPLDEQKIPRGSACAVQPGMPFPNLYQCNKVLVTVYQKQNTKKACKELGCIYGQFHFLIMDVIVSAFGIYGKEIEA